jgi:hypothetical protein
MAEPSAVAPGVTTMVVQAATAAGIDYNKNNHRRGFTYRFRTVIAPFPQKGLNG